VHLCVLHTLHKMTKTIHCKIHCKIILYKFTTKLIKKHLVGVYMPGVMRTRQRPPVSNVTVHHEITGYKPQHRACRGFTGSQRANEKKENMEESDLITNNSTRK